MSIDKMTITILDDGRIKIDTDQVSMPNHASAEEFLRLMAELSGGTQERVRKAHGHAHHHEHEHEHEHAHGGHAHE